MQTWSVVRRSFSFWADWTSGRIAVVSLELVAFGVAAVSGVRQGGRVRLLLLHLRATGETVLQEYIEPGKMP